MTIQYSTGTRWGRGHTTWWVHVTIWGHGVGTGDPTAETRDIRRLGRDTWPYMLHGGDTQVTIWGDGGDT